MPSLRANLETAKVALTGRLAISANGQKASRLGTLFADIAPRLLEQGYSPIPVREKRPAIDGWTRYCTRVPSSKEIARWAAQFPAHNLGGACGRLVAIDIDEDDLKTASDLQRSAFAAFGDSPLIRIGRAPRRVLLYRAETPFASIKPDVVQVLAEGSQVVLFGEHPGTGKPYAWVDDSPIDVPLTALPTITEEKARSWLYEIGAKKMSQNWTHLDPTEGADLRIGPSYSRGDTKRFHLPRGSTPRADGVINRGAH